MNNLIQKQKEDEREIQKKKKLLQQIYQIRHKISELQQIQAEIQTVSSLLKLQQKSAKSTKQQTSEMKNTQNSNTNKKIKIYELQKKLAARNKEYKDQHLAYISKLKKQQQTYTLIFDIDQQIRNEKDTSKQLNRLFGSLVGDIHRIQEKYNENVALLKNEKQILEMYQKEKVKKIAEIKRLKKIIKKGSEQTQPDEDDVVLSVGQNEQEDTEQTPYSRIHFESVQKNSIEKPLKKRKYSQEILLSQQSQYQPPSPKKSNIKTKNMRMITEKNENYPSISKTQLNVSFDQLQNQVYLLEESIEKDSKLYDNLLQSISLIKRGNKNLEASVKHSEVTIQLLKNRIQVATKTNQQQTRQLLENLTKSQTLYCNLKSKQGKRGELRGNLGIKVQNSRILGIINEEINLDIQKLHIKIPQLKGISSQCLQIINRFFSYQKLVKENIQNLEKD